MNHCMRLPIAAAVLTLAACAGTASTIATAPSTGSAASHLARPAAGAPPVLSASPQPLDFTMPRQAQSFTVNDPGYKGTLKAKAPKNCKNIVKISRATALGPNGTFDAVAIGAGRCDVTVKDAGGHSVTETIHVTLTSGSIN